MSKNLSEHEEINLHIKKRTFKCILRGIFFIPIMVYTVIGMFVSMDWSQSEFTWWMFGQCFGVIIFVVAMIYLTMCLVAWRWMTE